MWSSASARNIADQLSLLSVPTWPHESGYVSADDLRSDSPASDAVISAIQEGVMAEFFSELDSNGEPTRRGAMLDDLAGQLEKLKSTFDSH
jgi:hypothetical protein